MVTSSAGFVERAESAARWRVDRAVRESRRRTRHATARLRVRPTFLVIGAQKAATTSLHEYLRGHPAVLTANLKEVQYFNKEYRRGERWYLSHFPLGVRAVARRRRTHTDAQVGEATAAYLFDPRAPLRVREFDPEMKLVAVLRDPVARAYSHYQMELRWSRETLPFEDALRREEVQLPRDLQEIADDPLASHGLGCAYVARGRYAEQLERWLELFPREQLLVLVGEELLSDPTAQLARVTEFLGLPPGPVPVLPHRGAQVYAPMDAAVRDRLAATFEPENRRLEELLGRRLPWASSDAAGQAASRRAAD
jgi:hypothetical protein